MIIRIINEIKKNSRIAISFHKSIDGDSLGSSFALYLALKKLSKEPYIICEDNIPNNYKFLPNSQAIESKFLQSVKRGTQLLITLDCGSINRLSGDFNFMNKDYLAINLDHHGSNDMFGDINFVDTNASCMGEIVYQILRGLNADIDIDIASYLYTSIISDTGNFKFSNTTSLTHSIAGDLLNSGIDHTEITRKVMNYNTFRNTKLIGKVLMSMEYLHPRAVFMSIFEKDIKAFGLEDFATSDVIDFGLNIENVDVSIVAKEIDDGFKISLRSKNIVDVKSLAEVFNGGGHTRASGCIINNKDIEEVKDDLLMELNKEF